jgi:hypothetical protein
MSSAVRRHRVPQHPRGAGAARPATFVGRLVYPTGHGRRSLIVECHPTGDGFTISLPGFNEASNYLDDAPVALTAVAGADLGSAATIAGRSRAVADQDIDSGSVSALERWPRGLHAHYFRITLTAGSR